MKIPFIKPHIYERDQMLLL